MLCACVFLRAFMDQRSLESSALSGVPPVDILHIGLRTSHSLKPLKSQNPIAAKGHKRHNPYFERLQTSVYLLLTKPFPERTWIWLMSLWVCESSSNPGRRPPLISFRRHQKYPGTSAKRSCSCKVEIRRFSGGAEPWYSYLAILRVCCYTSCSSSHAIGRDGMDSGGGNNRHWRRRAVWLHSTCLAGRCSCSTEGSMWSDAILGIWYLSFCACLSVLKTHVYQ